MTWRRRAESGLRSTRESSYENVRTVQRNSGRTFCAGLMLAALGLAGVIPGTARAGAATEAMKGTIEEVLRILADKDLKQPAKANERRQLLEKVVGERFDYQEMSRRSLGAPWGICPTRKAGVCLALPDPAGQHLRR